MRGKEDPGSERSALCNLAHASFVHASWRNRKRHQPVILHHHREALSSLVQHRRPGTRSDHTLSGSQITQPVCVAFANTRLADIRRPSAIVAFLLQNGVNATALTLLVEQEYRGLHSRVVGRYSKVLACTVYVSWAPKVVYSDVTSMLQARCILAGRAEAIRDGKELMYSAPPTAFGSPSIVLSSRLPHESANNENNGSTQHALIRCWF